MNVTTGDWIATLAIVLVTVPMLGFVFRYGRLHLDFPSRLNGLMGRLGLRYERLGRGEKNVATFRCNTCENTAACDNWRESDPDNKGYRAFCPNAAFIGGLTGGADGDAANAGKAQDPARPRHRPF